jgi:hypothetical protein
MAKGGGRKKAGKGKTVVGDGPVAVRITSQELGIPGSQSVEVGYRAPYAVFVHEDVTAKHRNGQAKFLETPARSMMGLLAAEAQSAIEEGASRREALLDAGETLLGASKPLVPVDTGYLLSTGYVAVRRGS